MNYFSGIWSTFFDLLSMLVFEVRLGYLPLTRLETPPWCKVNIFSLFQSPEEEKKKKKTPQNVLEEESHKKF